MKQEIYTDLESTHFYQTVENSHYWTNIDQIINVVGGGVHNLEYILKGLVNMVNNGYEIVKMEKGNEFKINPNHIEICGRNSGELTLAQWEAMKEILGSKEWIEKVGLSVFTKNFKINGTGKI